MAVPARSLCALALALAAAGAVSATRSSAETVPSRLSAQPQRSRQMHNPLERLNVRAVRTRADSRIAVAPDRLALGDGRGEWFSVSWSGVEQPRFDDLIALVVPADANLTATAPAKWKFAAGDPQHVIAGRGTLRFRLISYRADVAFALLRNGFDSPVEVARSEPVRLLRPNQPLQLHLALTGQPGEMAVQWITRDAGAAPQVRWGPQPVPYDAAAAAEAGGGGGGEGPAYPHAAPAATSSYGREDLCGGAATSVGWVKSGRHHVATMAGLAPAAAYYYRVGDPEGGGGWSEERMFWSAPQASPDAVVRLLAVADMGQAEADGSLEGSEMMPSLNTTQRMAAEAQAGGGGEGSGAARGAGGGGACGVGCAPTLVLHNGDVSYARGYATQWDNFMAQIEPLAGGLPYMVAPGNHERNWPGTGDAWGVLDSGGECGVPYERRFPMPYPGRDKQWYGFAYGPVYFLQYSTEHPFGPGSEQHEFIVQTLRSVDRRRTPWLVVGGHRPPYVSSTNTMQPDGDQPVGEALRAAFEDLWLEQGVDLTLHGHHHSYQRSCPAYRGACQPPRPEDATAGGPVHLVIGHAGAGLSVNRAEPPPEWLEFLGLWWGYARLHVSGTELSVEVVADDDGRIMDSFKLRKPADWGERFMARREASEAARVAALAQQQRGGAGGRAGSQLGAAAGGKSGLARARM